MSNSLCRKMRRSRPSCAKVARVAGAQSASAPSLAPGLVPVSVTMIVKDCAETLAKTLESLKRAFLLPGDEVLLVDTGSQDGGATARVASTSGVRLISRPDLRCNLRPYIKDWLPELEQRFEGTDLVQGCILDFAQARQIAMAEAKHDIQFWIDSDDILEQVEPYRLRNTIDRFFDPKNRQVDSIFMDYIYWTDESDGSVTSILKRERVVDRTKYRWVGRCHETAIEQPGVPVRPAYFPDLGARIKHLKTPPDGTQVSPADIRNYIVIRREIEEAKAAGKSADPRSIFYLANAARGVRHAAEAIDLYKDFIPKSGSKEDRWAAAYYIATIYLDQHINRPYDALDWLQLCSRLKPEDPRSYFGLQRAYHQLQQYEASNFWFETGKTLPEPKQTLHNYDPRHINALPFQVRAMTAIKQESKKDLMAAMDALLERSPNHIDTKQLSDYAANWLAGEELVAAVQRVLANTGAKGEDAVRTGRELTAKLTDIPDKLEDLFLARQEPALHTDRKELDIFCGKAIEAWGPKSGIRGIGGSEKAVIQMAPRLQARGYQVNVYANVPRDQRGVDPATGVNWQHFGAYDFTRPRDTVIYWRGPALLENKMNYRRRILWCHDVQNAANWTAPRIALADQVWVLTEFHASTLGSAREALGAKLKITRNGIDSTRLREVLEIAKGKRDPFKIVYASSPDRGVLTAMKIFEAAKKIEPRLRLHVFYGFNKMFVENMARYEYSNIPDLGRDGHMGEYWSECLKLADRLEIPWHGRVGWDQLAAEMATAGIWLYPTRFPEISCMSAQEAMALGCVPVHSNLYALAETVNGRGHVISPDKIEEAAASVVRATEASDQERDALSTWALETYDYEKLADEWIELLKEDDVQAA